MTDEIRHKFRFGDRITNISAGDKNPLKNGLFVREYVRRGRVNAGRTIEMTDGNGRFWEVFARSIVPAQTKQEASGPVGSSRPDAQPGASPIGSGPNKVPAIVEYYEDLADDIAAEFHHGKD